jgi:DNA polymerase
MHRAGSNGVAAVATSSPPGDDVETIENKRRFVDVANVAAFSKGQNLRNPTSLKRNGFQNPSPEKAATSATNGDLTCAVNALDVTEAPRQSGDTGDTSTSTAYLDFETRNVGGCKLDRAGAWRYAADPATEILTLTYRTEAGEPQLWTPAKHIDGLVALAADPATVFTCFGDFEMAIWDRIMIPRFGLPEIPLARWVNTQATGSYLALPRALGKVLPVLGADVVKDDAGRRLVLSLSRPHRKTKAYPEVTPEALERVSAYNRIDVDGLAAVHAAVGLLPDRERRVWELDQTINRRGVGIDSDFVGAAKAIAEGAKEALFAEFTALTGGLSPHQVAKTREWLKGRGFTFPNLEAETVEEALDTMIMPRDVARVLQIRLTTAPTSLKKLDAMLACAGADGRARGLFQYHAATTGRWSATLIQPQNLPRPTIAIDPADIEELVAVVKTGDSTGLERWGPPIEVLMSALRYALVATDGARFGAGDFSMIETCMLLPLAGQHDKCRLIAAGADIYRDMAATIYRLDREAFAAIPKEALTVDQLEQRQVGKNTILGCGYGMGADRFRRQYCRHINSAEDAVRFAENVVYTHYRKNWAPRVPRLWRDLEHAARHAMLRPGSAVRAECGISYRLEIETSLPRLVCRLLNGKQIFYQNAQVSADRVDRFGYPVWTYWAFRKGWREIEPYGGQLTENTVQALARELLVDAMLRFEAHGYPVVMHCHDEIVVEHPEITASVIQEIMAERPSWAINLDVPVMVEAWTGKRYRK